MLRRVLLIAVTALGLANGTVAAHPIYVALPEETMTDQLTKSAAIVLAQPDPDNPFQFRPAKWLKGNPNLNLPRIPQLVDSATRARFAREADYAVLFVYRSEDQGWHRLANASSAVARMIDDLMAALPSWSEGRDDPNRFAFFASRHADEDPSVRRLALIELVQARYSLLRTLDPQLTVGDIEDLLRDPNEYPLASLFIVMLGLIDEARATTLVRRMVDDAHDLGLSTHVTAWATALVEIDGRAGVETLAQMAIGSHATERVTADAMLTALALHGTEGLVSERDRIAEILSRSAEIDTGFAVNAVATLIEWKDWRAAPIVEDHIRGGAKLALPERMALTAYLAAAQGSKQPRKAQE